MSPDHKADPDPVPESLFTNDGMPIAAEEAPA
jgi:hypothetical protein